MKKVIEFWKHHTYTAFLYMWIVAISIAYAFISIQRFNRFESATYDLGFFDQVLWQLSHFQWPYISLYNRFFLGDHLTLTLPLLALLYWLWNDVRILLIFQSVWLSLSALAVYRLALIRRHSFLFSFALAFGYSLFYGIQSAVFYEFHPISFAVGLLMWLLYFLESGKKRLFWISLILFLLTQENMGVALACVGIIYLFYKQYWRHAMWFIIGGIAYAMVGILIVGQFSPIGYEYVPSISHTVWPNITGLFDHPEKRLVWMYSLTAFLLLPLFSPGAMLAITVDLWQFFVAGNLYEWMRPPSAHHRSMLVIFLVLGVLDVMRKVSHKFFFEHLIAYALIIVSICTIFVFHQPLLNIFSHDFYTTAPWMKDAKTLFKRVPSSYSVATFQNFGPYLSHRNVLYIVEPRLYGEYHNPCHNSGVCWWLDIPIGTDYLIVTSTPRAQRGRMPYFDNFQQAVMNMEGAEVLQEVDREGGVAVYKIHSR